MKIILTIEKQVKTYDGTISLMSVALKSDFDNGYEASLNLPINLMEEFEKNDILEIQTGVYHLNENQDQKLLKTLKVKNIFKNENKSHIEIEW